MIAFGHTAVGVIVGVTAYQFLGQGDLVTGLVITGTAGVISHYFMDAIPHGHFFAQNHFKKNIIPIIIFDVFLSIIIFLGGIYLKNGFGEKLIFAMFGIGGSQLPDVIDGLTYTKIIKAKGLLKVENKIHEGMHWYGQGNKILLLGLRDLWQVLVILVALIIVILNPL